ncbi:MAG TPA: hypothetical protein VFD52_05000 [Clostridia bacterium]|nr:hypothetical protein [Clostridia bacterium]
MKNINDISVEGIFYTAFSGIPIQFMPNDTVPKFDKSRAYDKFIKLMEGSGANA